MKAQSVILLNWINWENEKNKYTAKFRKVESPLFTNYSGKFPIWTPTPLKRKKLQQPFSISFLRTKKSPHSLGVGQDTMRLLPLLPLLKLFFVILWPLNLHRMGLFRAAHGWGAKRLSNISHNDETWHSYILPKKDLKNIWITVFWNEGYGRVATLFCFRNFSSFRRI